MTGDQISLHGFEWHTHPRTVGRAILCLLARHRKVLSALDGAQRVERCSCGAMSLDRGRTWSRGESLAPRRGAPVPVDYDSRTEQP